MPVLALIGTITVHHPDPLAATVPSASLRAISQSDALMIGR
jgi:hypothetical protein